MENSIPIETSSKNVFGTKDFIPHANIREALTVFQRNKVLALCGASLGFYDIERAIESERSRPMIKKPLFLRKVKSLNADGSNVIDKVDHTNTTSAQIDNNGQAGTSADVNPQTDPKDDIMDIDKSEIQNQNEKTPLKQTAPNTERVKKPQRDSCDRTNESNKHVRKLDFDNDDEIKYFYKNRVFRPPRVKLGLYYERWAKSPPIVAHPPENDTEMELRIANVFGKRFLDWVDQNHQSFNTVEGSLVNFADK
uniref:Uncharacterized protein n=1 Tax=Heliothis virescens TaxID=7102 RepID=A0A2A4JPL7_HELVI